MSRSIRDQVINMIERNKEMVYKEDVVLKWVERTEERYTNGNEIGSNPTLEVFEGPLSTVELPFGN